MDRCRCRCTRKFKISSELSPSHQYVPQQPKFTITPLQSPKTHAKYSSSTITQLLPRESTSTSLLRYILPCPLYLDILPLPRPHCIPTAVAVRHAKTLNHAS
ncbi:hypothetical protein E4T56_gene12900 [Termitomyces sp. T112]|nr:hypothetical protein E4T56_gene12900 [Termitomyces sp. T112]